MNLLSHLQGFYNLMHTLKKDKSSIALIFPFIHGSDHNHIPRLMEEAFWIAKSVLLLNLTNTRFGKL
jgi:hypothetical protein